jgi:hypothetical protein
MTKLYKLDGDTKREYTEEEYAQFAIDEANYKAELKAKADLTAELAEKKALAEAKLAALGLTADDLKALGL